RRRPRLVQRLPDGGKCGVGRIVAHGDRHAIGGGDADQRRAAHPHVADRGRHLVHRGQSDDAEFVRQPALIDDLDRAAVLCQPDGTEVPVAYVHATAPVSISAASALASVMEWIWARLTATWRPNFSAFVSQRA